MAIETLAYNDVLNNKTAHFFKSGSVLRNDENEKLNKDKALMKSSNDENTPIECVEEMISKILFKK